MVEGFDVTNMGLRPSDWKPVPISSLITEFRGGAPLKPTDFKKTGFKVLPKAGVIRGGNLLIEKEKQQYSSREYASLHKSNIVDKSFTIVVLRDLVPSGPNIGLIVRINSDDKFLLAQGVYGFKVKENVSSDFLIHVSNTEDYRRVMRNIMVGSTQVHITNGSFKQVQVPLPPTKTEQTAIATTLNEADALISQLEQLLTKKRDIKTGAMQELLKPKEDWVEDFLTEFVDYIHGKAHEKNIDKNGKYVVVNSKYISSDGKVAKYSNQNFCPARKGDILSVLSDLPNGKALAKCFYVTEDKKFAVNQRICIWRSKGAFPKFLFYILNRNKYFLGLDDGISQTHILNHHIEKCKISIPKGKEEQVRIAQILSDMDYEIQELEKQIAKYKMIKHGMMQNLLTGKIRLV